MSSPPIPTRSSPRFAKKKASTLQQLVESDESPISLGCAGGSTMIGIPDAATKRDYNLNVLGTNHHSFSDLEDEDTSKEDDNEPNVAVDDIIDDIDNTDNPIKITPSVKKRKKTKKTTTNLATIISCHDGRFGTYGLCQHA
jgi:hypothetical protein